jgi:ATP-dependent DNA helicase DinG
MLDLSQFTPAELGLPDKFEKFRECQVEAVEWLAADERKRVSGVCIPPGGGKSGVARTLAKVTGLRSMVLTATRGLQKQYTDDFPDLIDIKGKANYQCADKQNLSCRFGAHEGCRLSGDLGCTYESAKARAKRGHALLTNYAYWIRINEFGRGLELGAKEGEPNPIELLICDEAHACETELSRALKVTLRETWLRELGANEKGVDSEDVGAWRDWAYNNLAVAKVLFEMAVGALKQKPTSAGRERVYVLEELYGALESISKMQSNQWVCELKLGTRWGRVWEFDCVWPAQWAEQKLFVGVPRIVLMSGTLHPSMFNLLGVKKDEREYREWPRVFPAQNTPIWHVRTPNKVKVNRHVTSDGLLEVTELVDRIIDANTSNGVGPRKGLIQTHSYKNQEFILARSKHGPMGAGIMLANTQDPDSDSAQEVAEQFRASDGPMVLVSPSFGMGWDFAGRQCEFIILFKVPYPDMRPKVMVERMSRNKLYGDQIAMQTMVQSSMRGTRFEQDRCNVYIVDEGVVWFLNKNKGLVPSGWRVMTVNEIPSVGRRCPE